MGSFCLTSEQESGTQVAIETIYRELERARNLSCGSGERVEEDQPFGDVDADWTLIDEEGDLQEAEVQTEVKTERLTFIRIIGYLVPVRGVSWPSGDCPVRLSHDADEMLVSSGCSSSRPEGSTIFCCSSSGVNVSASATRRVRVALRIFVPRLTSRLASSAGAESSGCSRTRHSVTTTA